MRYRLALLFATLLSFASASAADEPTVWVNATGNLGGTEWVKEGVWKVVGVPGSKELICSMMGLGLWSSLDGGATWKRMGAEGKRPPDTGEAVQIVFDPKNPKQFWSSGMYHYAVWKSSDGGATFEKLGPFDHVDGVGIDFTDPDRKTLVIGLHEQERSLQKSVDGGKTWVKIGDKLPEKSSFSTDPIVIDSKTFVTSAAGWKQGLPWGIYRTEDGGATWTKVSEAGASGNPLVTSNGLIFWPVLWDGALIKSADQGKTWTAVPGPVRGLPLELPGKRLVGVKETQLYVSADGGATWAAFGETLPFKPSGLAYSEGLKSIIAFQSNAKGPKVIVRWDLPADLDSAFKAVVPGKLTVWDGEGFNTGGGWSSGGFVVVQNKEKHSGAGALEFHLEGVEKWEGGWNWFKWAQTQLTDVTAFKNLSFWLKYSGSTPPAELNVALNCGPNKISSEYLPLAKYCKDALDGQWHDIKIPLNDIVGTKKDFDPRSVYELRLTTVASKDQKISVFVDDIRFDNRDDETPAKK
jgi:photosystem II stability/assembly factor-like uncharacterized protein